MAEPLNLAVIYGSTRERRFCDTIADWTMREISALQAGAEITPFAIDPIDPATLDLPARHIRDGGPVLSALRERAGTADAFIILTPEYNHGYPGPLKFLIDSLYEPWQAKPVAFVSYGGISGGLRAVEQLRLVFAELHAVTIRDTVSFANPWGRFDRECRLVDAGDAEAARQSLATMLAKLRWWALALRDARARMPYASAVA